MRYRLRLATWTVVRECGQPSPRILSDPAAAALLALDFTRACDDDKEHFFVVLLSCVGDRRSGPLLRRPGQPEPC